MPVLTLPFTGKPSELLQKQHHHLVHYMYHGGEGSIVIPFPHQISKKLDLDKVIKSIQSHLQISVDTKIIIVGYTYIGNVPLMNFLELSEDMKEKLETIQVLQTLKIKRATSRLHHKSFLTTYFIVFVSAMINLAVFLYVYFNQMSLLIPFVVLAITSTALVSFLSDMKVRQIEQRQEILKLNKRISDLEEITKAY